MRHQKKKDDSEKKPVKKLKKQKSEMEDQNLNDITYRKFWQIQDFFHAIQFSAIRKSLGERFPSLV